MDLTNIKTLGELRSSDYKSLTIQEEIAKNLKEKIRNKQSPFEGILGYENTVIPDVERALLSGHNINLLGLRGQAKTRLARQMISLLDEWTPIVKGTEINDDPVTPVSIFAKGLEKLDGF